MAPWTSESNIIENSMKTITPPLSIRGLGLIFAMLAGLWLSGCCDGDIYALGTVKDATTGALLDSVQVSLFYVVKRQASLALVQPTDSLGRFGMYDMGYCGKDRFFVVATKSGYISQSLDVPVDGQAVTISLQPL
jgi:hypothetical protein